MNADPVLLRQTITSANSQEISNKNLTEVSQTTRREVIKILFMGPLKPTISSKTNKLQPIKLIPWYYEAETKLTIRSKDHSNRIGYLNFLKKYAIN